MATLAEIRLASQQRADMENSTFLSEPEWNANINASYAELYDLLVSRFEDYYSATQTFTLSSGNTQALPENLYKVRGLDFSLDGGSNWATIRRWNFDDRNRLNRGVVRTLTQYDDRSYRVMGQNIVVLPDGNASGTYRLWFIPRFTPLDADGDEMGDVLDFEEYVIVDAAIKALVKEESDISALMAIKEGLRQRILAMSANRDTEPERISDVTSAGDGYYPWWGY